MAGNPVEDHYTRGDLQAAVLAAIIEAGYDPDALDPEALTPAEEFRTFGRAATVALADAAAITAGDRILDVGSGLRGPARHWRGSTCAATSRNADSPWCDASRSELNRSARWR